VDVYTAVYMSLDKKRILKEMDVAYYLYNARNENLYKANVNAYRGKLMNEIEMQNLAETLQLKCNVKVPKIYDYGLILAPTLTDVGTPVNVERAFLPLKRANSFDNDKISVRIFIEMEMIQNSEELTNVIYESTKTKCVEYKKRLEDLYDCLGKYNFSHGDMTTLGNILVNIENGNFALIDYGQSVSDDAEQTFGSVKQNINCNNARVATGGKSKRRTKSKKRCKRKTNKTKII